MRDFAQLHSGLPFLILSWMDEPSASVSRRPAALRHPRPSSRAPSAAPLRPALPRACRGRGAAAPRPRRGRAEAAPRPRRGRAAPHPLSSALPPAERLTCRPPQSRLSFHYKFLSPLLKKSELLVAKNEVFQNSGAAVLLSRNAVVSSALCGSPADLISCRGSFWGDW